MPYINLGGLETPSSGREAKLVSQGYAYPDGLDLRPWSKLHNKLKYEILLRAQESHDVMKRRHENWEKIDDKLTAYISLDDAEKAVKDKDDRKPVSIVVPVSYATLQTFLSYFMAAFLERPYFRYSGTGPEDRIGAMLLERVVDIHTVRSKVMLPLYTMWRDALAYGLGAVSPTWKVIQGDRQVAREDGFFDLGGNFIQTGQRKEIIQDTLWEGNALLNIDPYTYLPDPNVPVHSIQDGEFVAWVDRDNYVGLLDLEQTDPTFFNVKYLNQLQQIGKSHYHPEKKAQTNRFGSPFNTVGISTRPIDVIYMYMNIVPKDFKLSDKETPEKWFFALAADEVIIAAQPIGLDHNMFPVAVAAPEFDGRSIVPTSKLEVIQPMQEVVDWMVNSHIANTRKAINDMIVYDPSIINSEDLADPKPGKLIRARRAAWGRPIKDAVFQLGVTDVTRGHVADTGMFIELMREISGATDTLQGINRRTAERKTATEHSDTRSSAMGRLEMAARLIASQAHQDIALMFAANAQQLMDKDMMVQVTGRLEADLREVYGAGESVAVSPFDILINYDILPHSGKVPQNEHLQTWTQLFQIMLQDPFIRQQYDVGRVFEHIARQGGAELNPRYPPLAVAFLS